MEGQIFAAGFFLNACGLGFYVLTARVLACLHCFLDTSVSFLNDVIISIAGRTGFPKKL